MSNSVMITRRLFVLGAAASVAGCMPERMGPGGGFNFAGNGIDPQYYRQTVKKPANLPGRPGTVVVDPTHRFLYHVASADTATRYGVGVGREGFGWSGTAVVGRKAEWPTWTPPAAMLKRDPNSRPYANGMPGGPDNPLGARALYLYRGSQDTMYRIHGTNEPWTIGQAVSSGCIRMMNEDVIDLYSKVPVGTTVIVLDAGRAAKIA